MLTQMPDQMCYYTAGTQAISRKWASLMWCHIDMTVNNQPNLQSPIMIALLHHINPVFINLLRRFSLCLCHWSYLSLLFNMIENDSENKQMSCQRWCYYLYVLHSPSVSLSSGLTGLIYSANSGHIKYLSRRKWATASPFTWVHIC